MHRGLFAALIIGGTVAAAAADPTNTIYQINPAFQSGVHYVIDQGLRRVVIYAGIPGQTMHFHAVLDDGELPVPGEIALIYAEPNAGAVDLSVVGPDGVSIGASSVREINLSASGVDGTIHKLIVLTLGEDGPIQANAITESVWTKALYNGVFADEITGDVVIFGTLFGPVECRILGDFLVTRHIWYGASIHVTGPYYGHTFQVDGYVYDTVTFDSDVSAPLLFTGSVPSPLFDGKIEIGGNLYAGTGRISINLPVVALDDPAIHIHGSVVGATLRTTAIEILNLFDSRIAIDGDLGDVADIVVVYPLGAHAGITIDYDGWDPGDNWMNGGTISVDGVEYEENTPAARLWEVTRCKGDLNNDGQVNAADSAIFAIAMWAPNGYQEMFPGLEGSRVWHGDCDCDGDFDYDDYAPFLMYVADECCISRCDQYCMGNYSMQQFMELPAEQAAAILAESMDATELAQFIDALSGGEDAPAAGNQPPGGEDQAQAGESGFWADVLNQLLSMQ